jgi:dihydroneopterin aldolase
MEQVMSIVPTPSAAPPADTAHVQSLRRVFIDRYELMASVGIYERERRYIQRVIVSLSLLVNDDYDGVSDTLGNVYNYELSINAIKDTIESAHFNLIETMAQRIADICLEAPEVLSLIVRIEKPDVLTECRAVGIEIERKRAR